MTGECMPEAIPINCTAYCRVSSEITFQPVDKQMVTIVKMKQHYWQSPSIKVILTCPIYADPFHKFKMQLRPLVSRKLLQFIQSVRQ